MLIKYESQEVAALSSTVNQVNKQMFGESATFIMLEFNPLNPQDVNRYSVSICRGTFIYIKLHIALAIAVWCG